MEVEQSPFDTEMNFFLDELIEIKATKVEGTRCVDHTALPYHLLCEFTSIMIKHSGDGLECLADNTAFELAVANHIKENTDDTMFEIEMALSKTALHYRDDFNKYIDERIAKTQKVPGQDDRDTYYKERHSPYAALFPMLLTSRSA